MVYRVDAGGARVGVIPLTCRHGEHSLHVVGYTHYVTDTNVLAVSCKACAGCSPPRWDHYWTFQLSGELPDRAELDDEPYRQLVVRVQDEVAQRERNLEARFGKQR